MGKKTGKRYSVPVKPKWCQGCPDRKTCEMQVLPSYSERREFSEKYWQWLSPQVCKKVSGWVNQDRRATREKLFGEKRTPSGGKIQPEEYLDIVAYHRERRFQGKQKHYPDFDVFYTKWGPWNVKPLIKPGYPLDSLKEWWDAERIGFPFLSDLRNEILHMTYFDGLTDAEIAQKLSGGRARRKLTKTKVRNERKAAKRVLKQYASKYGLDYIVKVFKERESRGDLEFGANVLRARRILNKRGHLTQDERDWFQTFTGALESTAWRELWKK